jgi:hypothetical protein
VAANIIKLRVARLEREIPSPTQRELEKLSTEELTAALIEGLRDTIADPTSSPGQVQRAQKMLALPWGLPSSEWTIDELVFFCTEAHRGD